MSSDTYYRYDGLIPDKDGFLQVPDNIVIYLTQNQVDQIRSALTEAARENGKLRNNYINKFIKTEAVQSGLLKDSDIYINAGNTEGEILGPKGLDMFPKVNDANKLAQTDVNYNKEDPNAIPDSRNFVKKIKKWINYELITQPDYNNIITAIVRSSGSVHNDWVYSLTGEDEGRGGQSSAVLDIHDRRIDDPNIPLTVKGGVNVGDPDNPQDRKKLSVFGETELQDGTSFGRLLDSYGEQHPMEFGHQIPNEVFPKVYINRGEDRYNAEEWVDRTYGEGLGTIESTKEIVGHTTINADRGIIIEDGIGDERDAIIDSKEQIFDYSEVQEGQEGTHISDGQGGYRPIQEGEIGTHIQRMSYVFEANPNKKVHQTSGFGLSVHHDAANIQGHSYISDENKKNEYYLVSGVLKQPCSGEYITTEDTIIEGCWFCEDEHNEDDYKHYCTERDNAEVLIIDGEVIGGRKQEVVTIDKWPGLLYHKAWQEVIPKTDILYIDITSPLDEYNEHDEYYYNDEVSQFVKIQKVTELEPQIDVYKLINGNNPTYHKRTLQEIEWTIEVEGKPITNLETNIVDRFDREVTERIIPKIFTLYQLKEKADDNVTNYHYKDNYGYEVDINDEFDGLDYLYWTGIKFIKVPTVLKENLPKLNKTYGSLTVGTRANGIQANDTIGKHSVEIGTDNEATGNNALAQGQRTIADGVSSHAEGYGTKVTGPFAHAEGLGGQAGFVFKSIDDEELASIASVVSDLDSLTPSEGEYYKLDEDSTVVYYAVFYGESEETTGLPYPTIVSGVASHAEGYGQIVDGKYNHAEGNQNKILGDNTTSTHVEGSENIINEDANFSHIEGKNNIILAEKEGAHAAGAGNVIDRRYQHLEGVLAKTTHQVGTYIKGDNQDAPKSVMFAIGDGDSPTRADQSGLTPAANIVGHRDDPNYEEGNLFAVTEDGDAYVAGHFEVDGTSDLSKRATIGDDVAAHGLALDVLRHSRFRENVSIDAHGATSNVQGVTDWSVDKSLDVKGQSLFGDTLTIGEAGTYNDAAANRTGTFWKNLDQNLQGSQFIGLNVHGEIKNERIPDNLYTSTIIQGTRVFNEFADKFWTNSSIATNTATYRGCYTQEDYGPDHVDPLDKDAMAAWLDENVSPFVAGQITNVATYNALPIPALVSVNTIYHTLDTNKYYQWVWDVVEPGQTPATGDYEEVDATPDKNDYCFVQIEENGSMLPYVLFPDNEGEEIEIGEVEEEEPIAKTIVTHRYKYVQIIDPVSEEVLNQGWRFEYQLNNSGFTQAQWDTINSGVTASWRVGIEGEITTIQSTLQSEVDRLDGRIDDEEDAREAADTRIEGLFANYVTLATEQSITGKKDFTNPNGIGINGVYLKNTNNSVGYFSLPDQNHINETLLSTSDLDEYIKYDQTPQKSNWKATNEVPEFKNSFVTGRTIDGTYYHSSLWPGVDGRAYCLPGGKGAYELALKSDFYTKTDADDKYQTKSDMSNYVTCNNTPDDQEITGKKIFRYGLKLGNYHGGTNTPLDNKSDAKVSRVFAGSASEYCLPGGNRSNELALKSYVDDQVTTVKPKKITASYTCEGQSDPKTVSTYALAIQADNGTIYIGTFNFDLFNNSPSIEQKEAALIITSINSISNLSGSQTNTATSVRDFDKIPTGQTGAGKGWKWTQNTALATKSMSINFQFLGN